MSLLCFGCCSSGAFTFLYLCPIASVDVAVLPTLLATIAQLAGGQGCWEEGGSHSKVWQRAFAGKLAPVWCRTCWSGTWTWLCLWQAMQDVWRWLQTDSHSGEGSNLQSTPLWCQLCEVTETPGEEQRHETELHCQRQEGTRSGLTPNWLALELGHVWWFLLWRLVGGRWSPEATDFVSQLAKAKARSEPFLVRRRMEQAWQLRWTGLLACAAARSFAASLLGLHGGRGADRFAPRSHEVECDLRFVGLSGQCTTCCGEVKTSFECLIFLLILFAPKKKRKTMTTH